MSSICSSARDQGSPVSSRPAMNTSFRDCESCIQYCSKSSSRIGSICQYQWISKPSDIAHKNPRYVDCKTKMVTKAIMDAIFSDIGLWKLCFGLVVALFDTQRIISRLKSVSEIPAVRTRKPIGERMKPIAFTPIAWAINHIKTGITISVKEAPLAVALRFWNSRSNSSWSRSNPMM